MNVEISNKAPNEATDSHNLAKLLLLVPIIFDIPNSINPNTHSFI